MLKYINLQKILDIIGGKSPLQIKKINKYISKKSDTFLKDIERLAAEYINYLESQNISVEYAVDSYLTMCGNMLKSQIYFMKTGKYPLDQQHKAFENVYNNEKEMKSYMVGLAISQFLWSTHYDMISFFKDNLKEDDDVISSYLEVGPGHGLYLREAMKYLNNDVKIVAVDISQVSIEITQSMMAYFYGDQFSKIKYHNIDILDLAKSDEYDFITMGEVLEHVNYPGNLLYKLKELLTSEGTAFVSTCVNAPAIDHVYHFKSVDEIRNKIGNCGLLIKDEKVLPVENLPLKEIEKKQITINYCAILGRN